MLAPRVHPRPQLAFFGESSHGVSQVPCHVQGGRSFKGYFVCVPTGAISSGRDQNTCPQALGDG